VTGAQDYNCGFIEQETELESQYGALT